MSTIKYRIWDDEFAEWTLHLPLEVPDEDDRDPQEIAEACAKANQAITGLSDPWEVVEATGSAEGGTAWLSYGDCRGTLIWGTALL